MGMINNNPLAPLQKIAEAVTAPLQGAGLPGLPTLPQANEASLADKKEAFAGQMQLAQPADLSLQTAGTLSENLTQMAPSELQEKTEGGLPEMLSEGLPAEESADPSLTELIQDQVENYQQAQLASLKLTAEKFPNMLTSMDKTLAKTMVKATPELIDLHLEGAFQVIDLVGDVVSFVPAVGDIVGCGTEAIGTGSNLLPEAVDVAAPVVSSALEMAAPLLEESLEALGSIIKDPSQAPQALAKAAGDLAVKEGQEIVEAVGQIAPEVIDLGIEALPEVVEWGGNVAGFVPVFGDAASIAIDVGSAIWNMAPEVADVAAPILTAPAGLMPVIESVLQEDFVTGKGKVERIEKDIQVATKIFQTAVDALPVSEVLGGIIPPEGPAEEPSGT